MTHVSKKALPDEKQEELFEQLNKIVSRLDKSSTPEFLDELLGTEEKIMLAKRLAAIILYIEGNSSYRVWTLLKISPSTADRIRLNFQIGKYKAIQKFVTENKTEYARILKTLETILQAGLPPRGRGRWKRTLENLTRTKSK